MNDELDDRTDDASLGIAEQLRPKWGRLTFEIFKIKIRRIVEISIV